MAEQTKARHPPSLNKFMHPRNIYKTPPSFKQLATLYPSFKQYCTYDVDGKVRLDFSKPQALAELAIALMHKDFNLKMELPSNHLVPTIPLRLNYLLWLQDLVGLWVPKVKPAEFSLERAVLLQKQQQTALLIPDQSNSMNINDGTAKHKPPSYVRPVVGYDIGCGASCVYGLLGAKHCGWSMVTTDTDHENLLIASKNVAKNDMAADVLVLQGSNNSMFSAVESHTSLAFLSRVRTCHSSNEELMETDNTSVDNDGYLVDFSMCNPPFFSSEQETDSCSKTKRQREPPRNAPTGTINELIVEGGEIAFIERMVNESVQYKHKIRVFSTLVGAASHLKAVKQLVASVDPLHSTVTEFCQGRTMRWGIAWTWCPTISLEIVVSKKQTSSMKPIELQWPKSSRVIPTYTVHAAWEAIENWLHEIKLKPKVFKSSKYYIGANLKAYKATWQNQRRKRREEIRKNKTNDSSDSSSITTANDDVAIHDPSSDSMSSLSDVCCGEGKRKATDCAHELECKRRKLCQQDSDNDDNDHEEEKKISQQRGLPCLLKSVLSVKMIDNKIIVEIVLHGGLMGREGANQLLQYFKNKMQKPSN